MSDETPTVLVVDDEAINRIVLQGLIERLNVPCHLASGGEEALEIIRRTSIDLVFLDLQMPPPDGFETARLIREIRGGDIAIYALTAYRPEDVRERAKREGFDEVLQKPLDTGVLIRILGLTPVSEDQGA